EKIRAARKVAAQRRLAALSQVPDAVGDGRVAEASDAAQADLLAERAKGDELVRQALAAAKNAAEANLAAARARFGRQAHSVRDARQAVTDSKRIGLRITGQPTKQIAEVDRTAATTRLRIERDKLINERIKVDEAARQVAAWTTV